MPSGIIMQEDYSAFVTICAVLVAASKPTSFTEFSVEDGEVWYYSE